MVLPRKLAHRDKFVYELIQDMPGICDDDEPIQFPDNTTNIKFVVEMNLNEATKLLSALMTGADLSYPNESHEVVWIWLRQLECPVSLCDDLIACLSPLFEGLGEQITNLTEIVNEVREVQQNNGAEAPAPIETDVAGEICAGAAFVVDEMNREIIRAYNAAETSAADDLSELIPVIVEAIPALSQLPFGELFELANAYFENQQTDYEDDFVVLRDDLIGSLRCFIEANENVFDYNVWGDWLVWVGTTYPTDAAAQVFTKFAPMRQNFASDIIAEATGNPSLEEWFNILSAEYYAGTTVPIACPTFDCGDIVVVPVFNLTPCDSSAAGGINIESLGGTRWRVTSTLAGGDARVMLARSMGGNFQIGNVTFPTIPNAFALWQTEPASSCQNGFTVPNFTTLSQVGWTWNAGDAGAQVEFDMYAA